MRPLRSFSLYQIYTVVGIAASIFAFMSAMSKDAPGFFGNVILAWYFYTQSSRLRKQEYVKSEEEILNSSASILMKVLAAVLILLLCIPGNPSLLDSIWWFIVAAVFGFSGGRRVVPSAKEFLKNSKEAQDKQNRWEKENKLANDLAKFLNEENPGTDKGKESGSQ